MSTTPIFVLPDFTKPFTLETDASGTDFRVVLMQEGRPMAYMSKILCQRNQVLSFYEMEYLAVLMGIQKWRHYLQGRRFTIKTDQQSLKYLLDQKIVTLMQKRWITKLLVPDLVIPKRVQAEGDTHN